MAYLKPGDSVVPGIRAPTAAAGTPLLHSTSSIRDATRVLPPPGLGAVTGTRAPSIVDEISMQPPGVPITTAPLGGTAPLMPAPAGLSGEPMCPGCAGGGASSMVAQTTRPGRVELSFPATGQRYNATLTMTGQTSRASDTVQLVIPSRGAFYRSQCEFLCGETVTVDLSYSARDNHRFSVTAKCC